MSGAFVKIDTIGADEIRDALDRLATRAGNLTSVFADIGKYLLVAHDRRFATQRSPEGDPWAPLSPRYLARKRRNRARILVLDDLLGGTLRYQTTAEGLVFGTDRVYGATHQFGRPEAGIPARPFLGLAAEDEREALRLVGTWLL